MSMRGARGWGALSTGIGNTGQALLEVMARQKEEERLARALALEEELGRGELAARQQEAAQRAREFDAETEREYTTRGFEYGPTGTLSTPRGLSLPTQGAPPMNPGAALSSLIPKATARPEIPAIFEGASIGMGGPIRNQGQALLQSVRPPREQVSVQTYGWKHNPERDPAFVQAREANAFTSTENAADRAARSADTRFSEGAANARNAATVRAQMEVARINANDGLSDSDQGEAEAAAATLIARSAGDIQQALAALDGDTSREAALVRAEIRKLEGQRNQREYLGIGGGGTTFGNLDDIMRNFGP